MLLDEYVWMPQNVVIFTRMYYIVVLSKDAATDKHA